MSYRKFKVGTGALSYSQDREEQKWVAAHILPILCTPHLYQMQLSLFPYDF